MNYHFKKWLWRLSFYLVLLLLWQGVVYLKVWPSYAFPSPTEVFQSLVDGFGDRSFIVAIRISFQRLLLGYSLSIFGGLVLGFLIAHSLYLEETVGSLILGLHTLPNICWLPIGILWFGLSDAAIILVIVLGSLFSFTIATRDAIKNISPIFIRAARTMGSQGFSLYRGVVFPAALPHLLSGLKQSWSFAWRSLMAGELLFVSLGLGHLLQMGRELNDAARIFAVMAVIVAIALAVDFCIFGQMEKRIRMRWGLTHS